MKNRSLVAWFSLLMALLLWAAVVYGYVLVDKEKNNYSAVASNTEHETQVLAWSSRLHGLLNDSKAERTALTQTLPADVISVVDILEALDKKAGITVKISNAAPEYDKNAKPGSAVPVSFIIEASGQYAQMARFLQLFSSLTIPTSIQQFDLTRQGASLWHLSARIRVLTASEIKP